MNFQTELYNKLLSSISLLESRKDDFFTSPSKDFSRVRKLPLKDTVLILMTMQGQSLNKEMYRYFKGSGISAGKSAFVQRRARLKPEALEFLFHEFSRQCADDERLDGLRMLACDGSDVNIPYNPCDTDTLVRVCDRRPYNQIHLNALYDMAAQTYVDAIIQPACRKHENDAFREFASRNPGAWDTLMVADRGYECYANMVCAEMHCLYYLIRGKGSGNSVANSLKDLLPADPEFDREVSITLTTRKTGKEKEAPARYRYIRPERRCGYLDPDTNPDYDITFRIARVKVSDNIYEYLLTNLPADRFPMQKLKDLYHMRWGIETSFRDLKYSVGLVNFHSRKYGFLEQEIWARLLLYNFCMAICRHAVRGRRTARHACKANFSEAVFYCRDFILSIIRGAPLKLDQLISRGLLPIRPGRSSPRNMRRQSAASFNYRIS